MKKLKINSIHHAASLGILILFSLLALASADDDWSQMYDPPEYQEGPCEEITPIMVNYTIVVRVKDKITGKPIPNAKVSIEITHTFYKYLGASNCQVAPGKRFFDKFIEITDETGMATFLALHKGYELNIDHTEFEMYAEADGYNLGDLTRKLSPETTSIQVEIHLINESTEP